MSTRTEPNKRAGDDRSEGRAPGLRGVWWAVVFLAGVAFAAEPFGERGLYDYLGDLDHGKLRVGLTLSQRNGQRVSGSYFYRSRLKDIPLIGEFTGERDVVLSEKNAVGQTAGTFHLHLAENDPRHSREGSSVLTIDVLTGTWMNAEGTKTLPVYLGLAQTLPGADAAHRYAVAGAADDTLIERNARAFCRALSKGDRQGLANLIRYPVSFSLGGKRVRAANEQEFLKSYETIFTPKFVARIGKAVPHHMFANSQGIMLADGGVWFDGKGKIFAINN